MALTLQDRKLVSAVAVSYRLLNNYLISPLLGKPSTAGFWWLQELARVRDQASFSAYLDSSSPSPLYLMDYSSKLRFEHVNDSGIIVLPYGPPIGDQVNPEAAFIFALALHDCYRETGRNSWCKRFMHYADYFRAWQSRSGDWTYRFDWPGSPAPWISALAQGRGASVMLRAWMISGDQSYLDAARNCLSRFNVPIDEGGYQAIHPKTGTVYYEEYPSSPTAVMNGFMASLFGCWEVGHWANDAHARDLFDRGIESLAQIASHYVLGKWSLYNLNSAAPSPNYNTPRYHDLVGEYFDVLAVLSGSAVIARQRDDWKGLSTPSNRIKALTRKLIWKARYGVFSS